MAAATKSANHVKSVPNAHHAKSVSHARNALRVKNVRHVKSAHHARNAPHASHAKTAVATVAKSACANCASRWMPLRQPSAKSASRVKSA